MFQHMETESPSGHPLFAVSVMCHGMWALQQRWGFSLGPHHLWGGSQGSCWAESSPHLCSTCTINTCVDEAQVLASTLRGSTFHLQSITSLWNEQHTLLLTYTLTGRGQHQIVPPRLPPAKALFLFTDFYLETSNYLNGRRSGRGSLFDPGASVMLVCCYQTLITYLSTVVSINLLDLWTQVRSH